MIYDLKYIFTWFLTVFCKHQYQCNVKKLFKYSILSIFPIFLLAQSAEVVEPIDDRALMEKAIEIEASSSNKATERQDFIDNIDTQIITLTGDIQFLSQQLDLTNIYNRQLQELIDSQNAEICLLCHGLVSLTKPTALLYCTWCAW